jgi:two-component system nitrogen regulation response regulator GlnG
MVMPTTNGLDLYKRIQKSRPSVRVVLMTGYAVEAKMREALSLGAFDYLYKPFDLTDIMAILKKVMKQEGLKPLS